MRSVPPNHPFSGHRLEALVPQLPFALMEGGLSAPHTSSLRKPLRKAVGGRAVQRGGEQARVEGSRAVSPEVPTTAPTLLPTLYRR